MNTDSRKRPNKPLKKRRINTRVKGRRNELKTKEWLEDRGYRVEVVPMPSKWKEQQDFFGLFDIIAVSLDEVLLVQVKSNRKPDTNKMLAMTNFAGPKCLKRQVFVWKDRIADPIIIDL